MDRGKDKLVTFFIIYLLAMVYIVFFSESGYIERKLIAQKSVSIVKRVDLVKENRENLQVKLNRLKHGIISNASIIFSGYLPSGKSLLYIDNLKIYKEIPERDNIKEGLNLPLKIAHLRIMWIIVSLLILILYYGLNREKDNSNDHTIS